MRPVEANWPGGSYDPETGTFYIFTNTNVAALGLVPGSERPVKPSDMMFVRGQAVDQANPKAPAVATTVQGLPLIKPPYGRITAIDLHKGELLWAGRARRHARQRAQSSDAQGAEHPADRPARTHRHARDEDAADCR
jgi:hypothetical protein